MGILSELWSDIKDNSKNKKKHQSGAVYEAKKKYEEAVKKASTNNSRQYDRKPVASYREEAKKPRNTQSVASNLAVYSGGTTQPQSNDEWFKKWQENKAKFEGDKYVDVRKNQAAFESRVKALANSRFGNLTIGSAKQFGGGHLVSTGVAGKKLGLNRTRTNSNWRDAKEVPYSQRRRESYKEKQKQRNEELDATRKVSPQSAIEGGIKIQESGNKRIEKSKKGLSTLGKFGMDVANQGMLMFGDVMTGVATGGTALPSMASRSFGSAVAEAKRNGASDSDAYKYGISSAAVETLTEKIFAGSKYFKKIYGKGFVGEKFTERIASKAVKAFGKSEVGKNVIHNIVKTGLAAGEEGAEEVISALINPYIKGMTYDKSSLEEYTKWDGGWKQIMQGAIYDFLVGGTMGLIGGGASVISDDAIGRNISKIKSYDPVAVGGELVNTQAAEYAQMLKNQGTKPTYGQIAEQHNRNIEGHKNIVFEMAAATTHEELETVKEKYSRDPNAAIWVNAFYKMNGARIADEMEHRKAVEEAQKKAETEKKAAQEAKMIEEANAANNLNVVNNEINIGEKGGIDTGEPFAQQKYKTRLESEIEAHLENETDLDLVAKNYSEGAARTFVKEFKGDPNNYKDVESYSIGFGNFYSLGKLERNGGMTFEKAKNINPAYLNIIGETTARYAYEYGKQEVAKQKNFQTGETNVNLVENPTGKYRNKTNAPSELDGLYLRVAQHTGLNIERVPEIRLANGGEANAHFNPTTGTITISENADLEFGDFIHELAHAATDYHSEKMKMVREALVNWFVEYKGADNLESLIQDTMDIYKGISHDDALIEVQNEALKGLFVSEEGVNDFIDWLDKNEPENSKTILDKLIDLIDKLLEAITDMVKVGTMSKAAKEALNIEEDKARLLRKVFLKAVDEMDVNNHIEENSELKFSLRNKNIKPTDKIKFINIIGSDYTPVQRKNKNDLQILQNKVKGIKKATYINNASGYSANINSNIINKAMRPTHKKFDLYGEKYIHTLNAYTKIKELFENAVYIDSQPHTKAKNKNVNEYHYFVAPVNVDNTLYSAKITARERMKFNELYVVNLTLNKKIGRLHAVTNNGSTSKAILPAAISINDLISNVNTVDYSNRNTKSYTINDLQFSMKEKDAERKRIERAEARQRALENQIIKNKDEMIKNLKLQLKLTDGHNLRKSDIEAIAMDLKSSYKSKVSKAELTEMLTSVYNKIARDGADAFDNAKKELKEISEYLILNSKIKNEKDEDTKSFQQYMKTARILLSEEEKQELASEFDGYGNFTKKMFGKVGAINTEKYNKKGLAVPLDELYDEIRSAGAHIPVEMGNNYHFDIFNALLKTYEEGNSEYEYLKAATEEDIPLEIFGRFAEIRQFSTFADKKEAAISELSNELKALRVDFRKNIMEMRMEERSLYRQKLEDNREKRTVSLEKQDLKRQIIREVTKLDRLFRANTANRHVPDNLKTITAKLLNAFTKNTGVFPAKELANLSHIYRKYFKGGPEEVEAFGYDDSIVEMIDELVEALDKKPIGAMTTDELSDVKDVVLNVSHIIRTQNEIFVQGKQEQFDALGSKALMEQHSSEIRKKHKILDTSVAKWFDKYMLTGSITPVYMFKKLGGIWESLNNDLLDGQDKYAENYVRAKEKIQGIKEKYHYKEWADKKEDILEIKDTQNKDMALTREQALLIYATYRRELSNMDTQESNHILSGGFVYEKNQKSKKYSFEDRNAHSLEIETLEKIFKWLTSEQKNYADAIVSYLSSDMADLGNSISMQLYGIRAYKEKYYIPYNSSRYFLQGTLDKKESKLKTLSFTKKTVKGAANPLVLSDFSKVAAKHIDSMLRYNAFVIPLDNMNRVFNYKTGNVSMKNTLAKTYGDLVPRYIETYMKDVNGGVLTDPRDGMSTTLISLMKKSAVMMSMSVVLQQPTSIVRAFNMVDAKYFRKTLLTKRDVEEMKRYNPVAILKEMGRFDTNTGVSAVDNLLHEDVKKGERFKSLFTDAQYRDDALGFLPQKADEITWCHIWNAVKAETKDKTNLDGEELLKVASKRFRDVINKTQVYDSTLSRSENMRSQSTMQKVVTAFMAEPTVQLNMVMDAFNEGRVKKNNAAKKYIAKTIWIYIVANFVNAAVKSMWTASRQHDKDDDNWFEKYVEETFSNFMDGINPLNLFPVLRDAMSIVDGYNVERADMKIIKDFLSAADEVKKLVEDIDKYKEKDGTWDNMALYKAFEKISGGLASVFGIPVKNVLRDIRTLWNGVDMLANGRSIEGKDVIKAISRGITHTKEEEITITSLATDLKNGNDSYEELKDYYDRKIANGSEDKNIRRAMKSKISEVFKISYVEADEEERAAIEEKLKKIKVGDENLYSDDDFAKWLSSFYKNKGMSEAEQAESFEEGENKTIYPSSSVVNRIDYDPATMKLSVEVKTGSVYTYENVPQDTFDEFINAKSVGSYYNSHIKKGNY